MLAKVWSFVPEPLRRLLRPFALWRLRERVRRRRFARQVRHNVDIVAASAGDAWRWLVGTPATYRIRRKEMLQAGDAPSGSLVTAGPEAGADELARLVTGDAGAAVRAAVRPQPPRRAGVEPAMAPVQAVVPAEVIEEIGLGVDGRLDVAAVVAGVRQAGHRIVVVPQRAAAVDGGRNDPIGPPSAVVMSAVPMHDVGGGSRGAQLTLELLARGFHVSYVARYGTSAAATDLGLRFIHPHLEQHRFDEFSPTRLVARASRLGLVICELPIAEFTAFASALGRSGYRVVYDVIDDWSDPALGLDWYRPVEEARLVAAADAVTASAPDLAARVRRLAAASAVLIPNGVNTAIFDGKPRPEPSDLPAGPGPLIGYHGSLYGNWFSWPAVAAVAEAFPTARIVIIGEEGSPPPLPGNVHLLGLKPQQDLPAYLGRWDAAFIPWEMTETTHAVSPLKVYEYLATGVPVAAPPLRSLEGLAGVYRDTDAVAAVSAALAGERPDPAEARRQHGWEGRVASLLAAAGVPAPAAAGVVARTAQRPAHRYPWRKRLADWR